MNSRKSVSACPTIDELAGLLEPQAATGGLDGHLDQCATCRETLCFLAGEATWWDEASAVLAEPPPERRLAPTICALSTGEVTDTNENPLCEHELLQLQQLLEPASHPELIGRIGRYELEQLIGRGGMGLVFRARDTELHRVVAVKTLAIHLIVIGAARDRFVREARATASLTHPHIVPVYDVITDGAVPAIVMQYIAGPTLEQHLATDGPVPWPDVLQIGIQLADALTTAHDRGLVHRDIKPGNVLLEADGSRALLTDFGLVRALDDATLTRSGVLAGTPDYMSPEQAAGHNVTQASDLFSLGSLLYAMLTGHPPFRAENPMAVMNRICHQPHRPVVEARREVPLEISRLVDILLAKLPKKRFAVAGDVADRLRQLACSNPRLHYSSRQKRRMWVAAAACLVLALLGGLWMNPLATIGRSEADARSAGNPLPGPESDAVSEAQQQQQPSLSEQATLMSLGEFTELRILDQKIAVLRQDVDQLLNSPVPLTVDEIISSSTPMQDLDSHVGELWQDLERLGLELEEL